MVPEAQGGLLRPPLHFYHYHPKGTSPPSGCQCRLQSTDCLDTIHTLCTTSTCVCSQGPPLPGMLGLCPCCSFISPRMANGPYKKAKKHPQPCSCQRWSSPSLPIPAQGSSRTSVAPQPLTPVSCMSVCCGTLPRSTAAVTHLLGGHGGPLGPTDPAGRETLDLSTSSLCGRHPWGPFSLTIESGPALPKPCWWGLQIFQRDNLKET